MNSAVGLPTRMARLPRDRHGRPIPWFVDRDEHGVPDFRVVRHGGISEAYRFGWCWVCGQRRGRHAAFVIGPMCAVNRVVSEPPSHLDCALYSARACPFLATPGMRRRERGLPDDRVEPAGVSIERNPGVAVVWSSRTWGPFRVPEGTGSPGVLFDVGAPTAVSWWAHGRPATREEVLASIDSGLPLLRDAAAQDRQPADALAELDVQHAAALELIPS